MNPRMKGKAGVVAGARTGLGAAIARRLAAEGAAVGLMSRGEAGLRRLEKALPAGRSLALPCDVRDEAGLKEQADRFARRFGKIDFAVNSAGQFLLASALDTSREEWNRLIEVNLTGAFLFSKTVLPYFYARGKGDLVHIGSIAGEKTFPLNAAYCASKFGLSGLCAVLAEEAREKGVRVSLINPGAVDTPIWNDILKRKVLDPPPDRKKMMRPKDVAELCLAALAAPPRVHLLRQTATPFDL